LLGVFLAAQPTDKSDASPELALAVKTGAPRHGIGTALTDAIGPRKSDHSTISISFVAGKPVLRLFERFGFKVVEQGRTLSSCNTGLRIASPLLRTLAC
jgi:hypothetical protein